MIPRKGLWGKFQRADMPQLRLTCPAGARLPLHPREIRRVLLCMLHEIVPENAAHANWYEVELAFVRDAAITALNRQYLDCRGPTNCLAFPDAGRPEVFFGGSLFVSLDALYRECMLYGQTPAAYLLRLLAHGLAHLAGFDHGKDMDALCATLEACRDWK